MNAQWAKSLGHRPGNAALTIIHISCVSIRSVYWRYARFSTCHKSIFTYRIDIFSWNLWLISPIIAGQVFAECWRISPTLWPVAWWQHPCCSRGAERCIESDGIRWNPFETGHEACLPGGQQAGPGHNFYENKETLPPDKNHGYCECSITLHYCRVIRESANITMATSDNHATSKQEGLCINGKVVHYLCSKNCANHQVVLDRWCPWFFKAVWEDNPDVARSTGFSTSIVMRLWWISLERMLGALWWKLRDQALLSWILLYPGPAFDDPRIWRERASDFESRWAGEPRFMRNHVGQSFVPVPSSDSPYASSWENIRYSSQVGLCWYFQAEQHGHRFMAQS